MFRRRSEISAISAYIDTLLTHPGWKKFKEHWDRQSIDRFLDEREREIEYNPFLRKGRRFDYREEPVDALAARNGRRTRINRGHLADNRRESLAPSPLPCPI